MPELAAPEASRADALFAAPVALDAPIAERVGERAQGRSPAIPPATLAEHLARESDSLGDAPQLMARMQADYGNAYSLELIARLRGQSGGEDRRAPSAARASALPVASGPAVQAKAVISTPGDAYEREADAVAHSVVAGGSMPTISPVVGASVSRVAAYEQPKNEEEKKKKEEKTSAVQRQGAGAVTPQMTDAASQAIANPGAGAPLADTTRGALESRMQTDLSDVRVHDDAQANRQATAIGARAFAHGSDIWLGRGESQSDLSLMAHEATHVVQQRGGGTVRRKTADGLVQRLIPDFILERLADYARYIPGWTLFTVIIGFNPLTREAVPRTGMNLLEGFMGLVPFGTLIFDALRQRGVIERAFTWVEGELGRLDLSLDRVERTVVAAWDDVRLTEGLEYNLAVLRRHFGRLYDDVVRFATSLVDQLLAMIKEAVISTAEGLLAENRAWALMKKLLRRDPLRDVPVTATPTEMLEDFLILIGKEQHLAKMREQGTVEETANWLATQVATFMSLLGELRALFASAWEAIQPENLPNLLDDVRALAVNVGGFLQRVWDFASTVAMKVLELIKNALVAWLASFADQVPGFHLVTVILGRNPFTGQEVPRTAPNIIRGFITLLPGGNDIYARLEETGAIEGAAARIEGAMAGLGISWDAMVSLFTGVWNSLTIDDLFRPLEAFGRIIDRFGAPIARLFEFVGVVLREFIYLILQMMNFPFDLIGSIITNAMQAIADIKRDPIGFLLNMLAAVKLGFTHFFDHIATYLVGGLADWLFRGLRNAGIEPPQDLSFASVLGFVLNVLGISMDRIWAKLADRIGQENVDRIRAGIDRLVGIWSFIRDVQERGVVAIWEYIEGQLSNLWNMVLQKAQEWIMERIIQRAIQWLLSLLDITGIMPVINSFVAFFHALQSAIEYLRDILAIINDYVTTLAAVARGEIEPGAEKMERGLANAIPVAIGFLANQFGLGNIGEKISEIVGGLRELVDRALDWLIDRAVSTVESMMRALGFGGEEEAAPAAAGPVAEGQAEHWWLEREPFEDAADHGHTLMFVGEGASATLVVHSEEQTVADWFVARRAALPEHERHLIDVAEAAYNTFVPKRLALETLREEFLRLTPAQKAPRRDEMRITFQAFREALRTLGAAFSAIPVGARPEQIVLKLPPQKNKARYDVLLGQLAHSRNRPERTTRQVATWERNIRAGLPQSYVDMGNAMGLSPSQILRPQWTPTGNRTEMQVDHIVEWQVRPLGNENLLDDPFNYEMLDKDSNESSGQQIKENIEKERHDIADATGDQSWLFRDLTFTRIEGGGTSGIRWPYEDVLRGAHIEALARFEGRPATVPSARGAREAQSTGAEAAGTEALALALRRLQQAHPADRELLRDLISMRLAGKTWVQVKTSLNVSQSKVDQLREWINEVGIPI